MGERTQVWLGYFQFHPGPTERENQNKKPVLLYCPLVCGATLGKRIHVSLSGTITPTHNLCCGSLPPLPSLQPGQRQ